MMGLSTGSLQPSGLAHATLYHIATVHGPMNASKRGL